MIFGVVVAVEVAISRIKYIKAKKERKRTPGSDSRVVVHKPDIPRGAAGGKDKLGVAFGTFYCTLVGFPEDEYENEEGRYRS